MRFPMLRALLVRSGWCLAVALLGSSAGGASEWTATTGEMGYDLSRYALHIGGNYSDLSGTEVENVDPSAGLEIGASYRFLSNLSAFASYAINNSNVEGQVVHLLDQNVRGDGRSGNVSGEVKTSRVRLGIRLDALREKNWRFRPYLLGAVVLSKIDVTLDSVDGNPPEPVIGDPPDFPLVDISSFDDSQVGGLARFGFEYGVTQKIFVDLSATYEVIEFPSGTNALTSGGAGVVLRL